jgi:cytochrome c-type biogenesis protein CcmH
MSATNAIGYPTQARLSAAIRRPSFLVASAILLAVVIVWGVTAVRAVQPQTLDQHVNAIASQLQCPACNGESVADSSAVVAQEMRAVIREKVLAGESDQRILAYFQQRYGDTILESPPTQGFTALIWLGPPIALLAGMFIVVSVARNWRVAPAGKASEGADAAETLSADEHARYAALLRRELELDGADDVAVLYETEDS